MPITDGLITLVEAKASLNIATGVTANDTEIERYIEAATPVIEKLTGPLIVRSRTFTFDGGGDLVILPVAYTTLTSVVESGVTITSSVVGEPTTGLIRAGTQTVPTTFKVGVQNIVVTVSVGSATVPYNVKLAAKELVRHWYQQGKQGNRPSFGNEYTDSPDGLPRGVPTRRLQELLDATVPMPGFA